MSILMVTGHRNIVPTGWTGNQWPQNNPPIQEHHNRVFAKMVELCGTYAISCYEKGVMPEFINGMALGADQLFAQAVLRVKQDGLDCKLIAAVPFKGQESKWIPRAKEIFNIILEQSDEVVYVCDPGYAPWKMQKRNEWMVDRASQVLAVWSGAQKGGTFNCVRYARSKGVPIMQLNPQTIIVSTLT